MVAIPAYLLASSAASFLPPLVPRDTVIRSPISNPGPAVKPHVVSHSSGAFGSLLGPLVQSNFADPAIIAVDGMSYAFATNNRGIGPDMIHVQVATSSDNETWTLLKHDALPQVGAWQTGRRVWAPDVVELDDGTFVMYYSDEVKSSPGHHCIGAATSKNVLGPYDPVDTPFACPDLPTLGGAIDPDGFYDASTNKRYVTYKVDGNSIGHGGLCKNSVAPIVPTPIMLQEVTPDGITHIGGPVQILDRGDKDGPLIEAPSLHRSAEGIYFLFFSSDCFTTPKYDTSYATSTNILGPYTKTSRPLVVTGDGPGLVGPGGMDIIKGGNMIVFHGHLTINNDAAMRAAAEAQSDATGKPMKDIPMPLVRGMYSAVATFKGHTVSLAKKSS